MDNLVIGDCIRVTLVDGTIFEGELVRLGKDNMVVDDMTVFGDWVFIEFSNIMSVANCQ